MEIVRPRPYSKRQSTGALQNVAVFGSTYYALAFWSAAVFRRFSAAFLTQVGHMP